MNEDKPGHLLLKYMHAIVEFIQTELKKSADPEKAGPMQAYMKTDQPFLGVPAPLRDQIFKKAKKEYPIKFFEEYKNAIKFLWNGTYREEQYMALEIATKFKKFRITEAWPIYEQMAASAKNWDTIDWIAAHLIGELVLQNRHFEQDLLRLSESDNFWLRRVSLLAQLKFKDLTNTLLLAELIEKTLHEKEFFIRKAIGWILREYSKTNPHWVIEFVKNNEGRLSGLSKREALKVIQRSVK